jgi:hypothetical protein
LKVAAKYSMAEIADIAAGTRNVVRTALREAESLGLLTVEPQSRLELRSTKLALSIKLTSSEWCPAWFRDAA